MSKCSQRQQNVQKFLFRLVFMYLEANPAKNRAHRTYNHKPEVSRIEMIKEKKKGEERRSEVGESLSWRENEFREMS